MLMKKLIFLLAFIFVTVFATGVALAQMPTPAVVTDDDVNAVAQDLFCPECENIPLDVCPSQACMDMRAEIRQKLEQGWTKQQILDYYVERYGDRVLGAPPARGWNWMMYLIPPLAILVGLLVVYRFLISWRPAAPETPVQPPKTPSPPAATDDYVARLEAELKKAKE